MMSSVSSSIIAHPLQSFQHDHAVAADHAHPDPLSFAAGFLFDRFVEDDVEEDLFQYMLVYNSRDMT
jgi:hypothetical protein